jgi:hypothetical protein
MKRKKHNLNRILLLLTALLLISIVPWASVSAENNEEPYDTGAIHYSNNFTWVYDQVEYENSTSGLPGGVKFQRITMYVGELVGPNERGDGLRYTLHITNESNTHESGSIIQWFEFFDEDGEQWGIHLHHNGYHINDGKNASHFLTYLSGYVDLNYLKSHSKNETSRQCVLNFTITPPEIKDNSEGIKELTWSVTEHRAAFGWDNDTDEVDFESNHTVKFKTTWHFYVLNNSARIKQDLTVYDLTFTDDQKPSLGEDFENATLTAYWHIGVLTSKATLDSGRPDEFEVDGTTYDSERRIESGHNVSIKSKGMEIYQIDLGNKFRVNNLEDKNITSAIQIEPENPEKPEDGLALTFDQKFPNLNYSSFENFTMDPEIILPLNSPADDGGPVDPNLILIIVIATVSSIISLLALAVVIIKIRK